MAMPQSSKHGTPAAITGDREPVLDGIRGLAIALVLYHHFVIYSALSPEVRLDYHLFRIGTSAWLGVDLFFVLSGFLITGILYDAKKSQHYFRNFYARRALRIFPLYYTFLVGVFLFLPLFLEPAAKGALTDGQLWYWTYTSNIDVAIDRWQKPLHLGHFWSLAVEEQFYLIWPVVVLAFSRSALLRITALCFFGALLLRFMLPNWLPPLANYVLMPTRMDAFAAGAIVALLVRGPGGLRSLGAWPVRVMLASTAMAAALYQWKRGLNELDPLVRTFGYSIIAISFAALIAVALGLKQGSWLRHVLSNGILVTLGKYSYALYVFHHPIILLMKDYGLSVDMVPRFAGSQALGLLVFGAIAFSLTMFCALLSWRLVEKPFLELKNRFSVRGFDGTRHPAEPAKSATAPVAGLLTYVERPGPDSGSLVVRSRKR